MQPYTTLRAELVTGEFGEPPAPLHCPTDWSKHVPCQSLQHPHTSACGSDMCYGEVPAAGVVETLLGTPVEDWGHVLGTELPPAQLSVDGRAVLVVSCSPR